MKRFFRDIKKMDTQTRKRLIGFGLTAIAVVIYVSSSGSSEAQIVVETSNQSLRGGDTVVDETSRFYKSKEDQIKKQNDAIIGKQNELEEKLKSLEEKVSSPPPTPTVATPSFPAGGVTPSSGSSGSLDQSPQLDENPNAPSISAIKPTGYYPGLGHRKAGRKGKAVISFPVTTKGPILGPMIPPGSFVKAKLMTGVQTPEGKVLPSLLVLDYSFTAPNNSKINLTGCFALAKTQATLSTERVEFQVYKMSCVAKSGEMFERAVNGFVVDDRDNSFAVKGEVNSHQGRVAAMAFMSSVVSGAGEIMNRQAQNIGGANPDKVSADVIVQQGAQTAASKVVDWYLTQATSTLVPTISVKSGQDVWIVLNETVELPNNYFSNEKERIGTRETKTILSTLF